MYEVVVGLIFAALFVGVYLTIKTLTRRGDDGRALWRSLITSTPVDALSARHQLRDVNQLPSQSRKSLDR